MLLLLALNCLLDISRFKVVEKKRRRQELIAHPAELVPTTVNNRIAGRAARINTNREGFPLTMDECGIAVWSVNLIRYEIDPTLTFPCKRREPFIHTFLKTRRRERCCITFM